MVFLFVQHLINPSATVSYLIPPPDGTKVRFFSNPTHNGFKFSSNQNYFLDLLHPPCKETHSSVKGHAKFVPRTVKGGS